MFIFILCIAAVLPALMIFFGIFFKYRPPKNINGICGYRTARSMQNQETWDFAQAYYAKISLLAGIIMLIPSIVLMFVFRQDYDFASLWIVCVQAVVICLLIIPVEKALKKDFDEYGLRK